MSDFYGLPISIPPGVTAPDVSSLYQAATPNGIPTALASSLPLGAGAGTSANALNGLYGAGSEAASSGGLLSNLLGRGPLQFIGPKYLGGTGELGLGATIGRAVPPLALGALATGLINNALPSQGAAGNVRQVLGDAATGAGIGGAAGSVVPVIGTGAGALIGGVGGAAYGLAQDIFGGSDNNNSTDDMKTQLAQSANQLGLNANNYTAAFDMLTKAGADKKTVTTQLAQQILADAQTKQAQAQANAVQLQQRSADQTFALALQQKAQEFFAPYVNNIITAGKSQADLLTSLAQSLPAPYRTGLMSQAAQSIGQSQRLASAYAAQSSLAPFQFLQSEDLKRQQQLQQLQYQQAVIAAQQGRSGGSNGINQALTQQLAAQGQTP